MRFNQKRIMLFSAVILLAVLFLSQLLLTKELFKKEKLLQTEIKEQRGQNKILENNYQQYRKAHTLKTHFQRKGVKESTAEILEKLKFFKLRLIDFSSGSSELNLNLKGDFYSILQFIQYLEAKMIGLEIVEFKMKRSGNNLFLFLKLKNELI